MRKNILDSTEERENVQTHLHPILDSLPSSLHKRTQRKHQHCMFKLHQWFYKNSQDIYAGLQLSISLLPVEPDINSISKRSDLVLDILA